MQQTNTGGAVVITGAAQGIGYAIAERFMAQGRPVVIADIRGAEAAARKLGAGALGFDTDVSNAAQVDALMAFAAEHTGGVSALINNAGIYTSLAKTPFEDIDPNEWKRVFSVNVEGVWHCCRAAARYMKPAGHGTMINIASAAAFKGTPGLLHYVASKAAVVAMTRTLARELGPYGVRVNTVSPGFTQSDGILAGGAERGQQSEDIRRQRVVQRDILPDDIAGAVLFLAGPDAGMFAGQNLIVDGGLTMN
jgi:p-cumic alcohol dehydrogenase